MYYSNKRFNVINEVCFKNNKDLLVYDESHDVQNMFVNCRFYGLSVPLLVNNIMTNSRFVNCKFYNVVFSDCSDSKFENCDFENLNLQNVFVSNCNFNECRFGDSIKIHRSHFTYTNIENSLIKDLIMTNCTLTSSTWIKGCTFVLDKSSIAILNTKIGSEIKNCDSVAIKQLYLYKCEFTNDRCIHDNEFYGGLKVYETSIQDAMRTVCPEEGSFICYKKLYLPNLHHNGNDEVLATLEVPADAKRISSFGNKCRAEYVKVLKLEYLNGEQPQHAYSVFARNFEYNVGQEVHPDSFDDNPLHECSNGIHFFMTKVEAIQY